MLSVHGEYSFSYWSGMQPLICVTFPSLAHCHSVSEKLLSSVHNNVLAAMSLDAERTVCVNIRSVGVDEDSLLASVRKGVDRRFASIAKTELWQTVVLPLLLGGN